MAEYLGTVYLGGLYNNGSIMQRPTKPWRNDMVFGNGGNGDVPAMNGSMANYAIGNTPPNEVHKLKWHKIKDGNKTLLICDRNILSNVSWAELNDRNLVSGATLTIDGKQYLCRLLTGGTYIRDSSNPNSGGYPATNEWDRFITREEVIAGLPAPVGADLTTAGAETESKRTSTHNQLWNWGCIYSLCQEVAAEYSNGRTARGYISSLYRSYAKPYDRLSQYGWRPVLEVLNAAPLISDSDRDLGDRNSDFNVTYTINDSDAGDTLTVTESIDGTVIKTINSAVRNQTYTININVSNLHIGPHTVTISVSDGKGGASSRIYTFRRTNIPPIISGMDESLGLITGSFSKKYTVNDVEGDSVIVTESVDNKIIRSYTAVLNAEQTIVIPHDIWVILQNGNHNLKIEAVDSGGRASIRVFAFQKSEDKIVFELANPFLTDAKANKVLVSPTWQIEGATVKVEACNNAFDETPTWEEITAQVIINRLYNFVNATKQASNWGVNIRFTLEKNAGYEGEVNITGFGGAYE